MRYAVAIGLLLASTGLAGAGELTESRTLRGAWTPPAGSGPVLLTVDNVFGSIRVEGHAGAGIEWIAEETRRARTPEKLERARQEVELASTEEGRELRLIVEGPFRDNCRNGWNRGYEVVYDLEIRVPFDTDLDIRTVNDGEIAVRDVRGRFDVSNVNGGIELRRIAGSGDVKTINGSVRVDFAENPREDSSFETLNGEVELTFEPGLAADLEFETFNGEAWTDFDVRPLPTEPTVIESRDGNRRVLKVERRSAVRVAGGGPHLFCKTFNGDILIRMARNGA